MNTGLDIFDTSIQETNEWLKDIEQRLEIQNRRIAFNALKATLHAVRDRVGPENAIHLAAQLPMLLKGVFYDGWRPAATPTRERTKQAFLDHVTGDVFRGLKVEPERAVRACLEVLAERIDPAEVAKLERLFPESVRELWPAPTA